MCNESLDYPLSDSLVIVAIPSRDDLVWSISSEKVPHLTILYLGDQIDNPNLGRIETFIKESTATFFRNFHPNPLVERRGVLGDDEADVIFFGGDDILMLESFRSYLLSNPTVLEAFDSVKQFPKWTPHLTLGYPDTPAKNESDDIRRVSFDRIALWYGDYKGPEFEIVDRKERLSMSDSFESDIQHFGVLGMKWGVRSSETGSSKSKKQIAKGDKKWEKNASSARTFFKVHNAAADRMNKIEIKRINNKPAYKDKDFKKDSPLRRKYYKEYENTFMKIMDEETQRIVGPNASNTKRVKFTTDDNDNINYSFEDIKHADEPEWVIEFDNMNRIVKFELVDETLSQGEAVGNDILEHFGIKGMKWGVIRKNVGDSLKVSKDASAASKFKTRAKIGGVGNLDNKELRDVLVRMRLEQDYKNLISNSSLKGRGMKWAKNFLTDVAKDVTTSYLRNPFASTARNGARAYQYANNAKQISRTLKELTP